MPVTYNIYPARKLIRTKCIGDVNVQEVSDHFRELKRDPNRPKRLNVLLDLSEATSLPDAPDLRVVTHEIQKLAPRLQFQACAIVAANDALFGMMRMFEVLAHDYFAVTHVFRTVVEAETWLESQELRPAA